MSSGPRGRWRAMSAHAESPGHPSLAHIVQGTVCKILAAEEVKPNKVRYHLELRDEAFDRFNKIVGQEMCLTNVEELRSAIAELEAASEWARAVQLRISLCEMFPRDVEARGKLIWAADKAGVLKEFVTEARKSGQEFYGDLFYTIPLINYAMRVDELDWASQMISISGAQHSNNEWPVIFRARLLALQGRIEAALHELTSALPVLLDTYAFMNVSDEYYRIACAKFADNIVSGETFAQSGPAVSDALYVGLVKDEEDVIFANLEHHYRIGFRNFAIVNNNSTDQTESEINRFVTERADATVFIIRDPIQGYVQDVKTTAAMRFAAAVFGGMNQKIRWVFAIDADEFVWLKTGGPTLEDILRTLDSRGNKVLALTQINASTTERAVEFKPKTDVLKFFSRRMGYPGLPVFKVAAVYSPGLAFDVGNHRTNRDYENLGVTAAATEFGMFLLHLPLRSVKQVTSKVLNGISALNSAPHRVGIGTHWRGWYESYQRKGSVFFEELLDSYIADIALRDAERLRGEAIPTSKQVFTR